MATQQLENKEELDVIKVEGPLRNLEQSDIHKEILLSMSFQHDSSDKEEKESLSILVVGEAGVGKSTLINSFLGTTIDKKAQVSHGADATKHEPIEKHEGKLGPNKIIIYDTKGLVDVNPKQRDSQLMKDFSRVISNDKIDLVFICQRMFGRFTETTDHIVELLAQYFKKREAYTYIWERCILILTQANTYNFDDDEDETVKMSEAMQRWSIRFKEYLQKYSVPDELANNIPVCATGNKRNISLPVTENWILHLFDVCQTRCPPELEKVVSSLKLLRRNAFKQTAKGGAAIGATVGAILIPGVGAVPGATIGALVGLGVGKKTLTDMEEKLMKNAKERQQKQ